jgi:hypothetical protein
MNTWNKNLLNSHFEESKVVYVAEKPVLETISSVVKMTVITLPVVVSTGGIVSPQNL